MDDDCIHLTFVWMNAFNVGYSVETKTHSQTHALMKPSFHTANRDIQCLHRDNLLFCRVSFRVLFYGFELRDKKIWLRVAYNGIYTSYIFGSLVWIVNTYTFYVLSLSLSLARSLDPRFVCISVSENVKLVRFCCFGRCRCCCYFMCTCHSLCTRIV